MSGSGTGREALFFGGSVVTILRLWLSGPPSKLILGLIPIFNRMGFDFDDSRSALVLIFES